MKAFPIVIDRATQIANDTNFAVQENGMDLRDYFAAKAMQSILLWKNVGDYNVSQEAYMMADAMMEARKK